MTSLEYGFLIENDEGGFTVASNDGGGRWCRDVDEVRAYMMATVTWWCNDLADYLADDEEGDQ